jgi:hypothetical protein
VQATWNGLWGRNVTVRIDGTRALWGTSKLHNNKQVRGDRYLPWLFS